MAMSDPEKNHLILDMPDMGNSSLILIGSQASLEAASGNAGYAVIFGTVALSAYVYGQYAFGKGIEECLAEGPDTPPVESRRIGVLGGLLERARGISYTLMLSGTANDFIGGITKDPVRLGGGIGTAFLGMAMLGLANKYQPDLGYPADDSLKSFEIT